jgi:hypothetical protein
MQVRQQDSLGAGPRRPSASRAGRCVVPRGGLAWRAGGQSAGRAGGGWGWRALAQPVLPALHQSLRRRAGQHRGGAPPAAPRAHARLLREALGRSLRVSGTEDPSTARARPWAQLPSLGRPSRALNVGQAVQSKGATAARRPARAQAAPLPHLEQPSLRFRLGLQREDPPEAHRRSALSSSSRPRPGRRVAVRHRAEGAVQVVHGTGGAPAVRCCGAGRD